MGTRWRGLLAPINKPTGDGRRMKTGAFTHRELPIGLKWQRVDGEGHDASVVIGSCDTLTIDEESGEVWGEGELFDDQPHLARLTEDVQEALLLTSKKVIGPSVDAGSAEGVLVETGSDVPVTEERLDELWTEALEKGGEPDLEVLFTRYEIAAATLVVIPAFAEARPFELLAQGDCPDGEHMTPDGTCMPDDETMPKAATAALVASLTGAAALLPADVFADPQLTDYQPLTVVDRGEGFLRVQGLVAAGGVCHVGLRDACYTAPLSTVDYVPFHRYPQNTDQGLVATGRVTTGLGRVGTECTHLACRGKGDHACDEMSLGQTLAHYDKLQVLAYGRVGHNEAGDIWFAGIAEPDLTAEETAVLTRQRFSGDWRDVGGHLELVEVLALSKEQPGFPIPTVTIRNGRQMSLTAAGAVHPDRPATAAPGLVFDHSRLAKDIVAALRAEGVTIPPEVVAVTAAADVHTGAMVALRMTDADADRLAVEGGEPAEELHLTLAYLGEAADIDPETQQNIIDGLTAYASGLTAVTGDGFAVSVFNPANDDWDTAIVIGVDGVPIDQMHSGCMEALATAMPDLPEQHSPWVAHVTLIYSDDTTLVEQFTDRTGQPVTFDRLRIAFAGQVTDIPLGQPAEAAPEVDSAAALMAEVDAALDSVDADERSRAALALLAEIDQAVVRV